MPKAHRVRSHGSGRQGTFSSLPYKRPTNTHPQPSSDIGTDDDNSTVPFPDFQDLDMSMETYHSLNGLEQPLRLECESIIPSLTPLSQRATLALAQPVPDHDIPMLAHTEEAHHFLVAHLRCITSAFGPSHYALRTRDGRQSPLYSTMHNYILESFLQTPGPYRILTPRQMQDELLAVLTLAAVDYMAQEFHGLFYLLDTPKRGGKYAIEYFHPLLRTPRERYSMPFVRNTLDELMHKSEDARQIWQIWRMLAVAVVRSCCTVHVSRAEAWVAKGRSPM